MSEGIYGTSGGSALPRDEVFSLLSNRRRRYALHACKRTDDAIDVSDLAEQIAAWEQRKEVSELTSDERHRVYTSMQQTHLPTMVEAGVVEFDGRNVSLTERAETLEIYMDVDPEPPWDAYYLGLSAVVTVVLTAAWAGFSLSGLSWTTVIVAVLATSALGHVYRSRRSGLGGDERPPEMAV